MSQPLAADTVFQRWLSACQSSPWSPLTLEAAHPYRAIWETWLRHIAETPWYEANGSQVLSFINAAHLPGRDKPSEITRRRYWRILDRVYEHACLEGDCTYNPAQDVEAADRPPQEDPIGAVLSPRMWAALSEHLPAPVDAIRARDRAMLLTFMELGITSQEIINLRLCDVTAQGMQLQGPRRSQERVLPISEALATNLDDYQRQRGLLGLGANSDLLFISRHADPKLSSTTLQTITQKYMLYAAHVSALPEPPRLGAQIIRNTVITRWLIAGRPMREVLRMAGLQEPGSLSHLREALPKHIRSLIAASSAF